MCFEDMDIIDEDYHHILQIHIINGTKTTIENVFRFFRYLIHHCEIESEFKQCGLQLKQRFDKIKSIKSAALTVDKVSNEANKNILKLKDNYQRNKLEEIHEYLVHSDWIRRLKQHIESSEQHIELNEQIPEEKMIDMNISSNNTHKYVTELG
eukprot:545341_1